MALFTQLLQTAYRAPVTATRYLQEVAPEVLAEPLWALLPVNLTQPCF